MSIAAARIEAGAPPQVQAGDPKAKQAYSTALDFEQMLVGELSQSLTDGSGLEGAGTGEAGGEGEGAEGGGGASQVLSSLVPQALSESVMRGGGLGLAGALTRALDPASAEATSAASSDVNASGGSAAGAAGGAAA